MVAYHPSGLRLQLWLHLVRLQRQLHVCSMAKHVPALTCDHDSADDAMRPELSLQYHTLPGNGKLLLFYALLWFCC